MPMETEEGRTAETCGQSEAGACDTPAPGTAVVTVTYNSADALRRFAAVVDAGRYEWIVVDNGSRDESVQIARSLGATVIESSRNLGFSAANNIGARSTTASCLVFANPDVAWRGSDVARLASIALTRQAIVAPQLLNADGTLQENGRGLPYLHRKLLHRAFGKGLGASRYLRFARMGELLPVSWVIGAALVIPRAVFDDIGGWDDRYFIYYEDAELCLRAWRRGVPVYVDGDARWIHGWGRATTSFRWEPWKHEFRSAARFYATFPELLLGLPPRPTLRAAVPASRLA